MNNKSSLELFAIALYEKGFLQGNGDEINDLLEHHKAMHKEEHFKTWCHSISENAPITFNQYYNETYGGNK